MYVKEPTVSCTEEGLSSSLLLIWNPTKGRNLNGLCACLGFWVSCYLFAPMLVQYQFPHWANSMDLSFYLNYTSIKYRPYLMIPRPVSFCDCNHLAPLSSKANFCIKKKKKAPLVCFSANQKIHTHPTALPNWTIKITDEKAEDSTWTSKMLQQRWPWKIIMACYQLVDTI